MSYTFLVIHGPNLNLLGARQPTVYGTQTLQELNDELSEYGNDLATAVVCRQSNLEGEIITWIQEAYAEFDAIVINPGGYSHTSVAIADALDATSIPAIECHLSNIHAREDYRHCSLTASKCRGVIAGFGSRSYKLALDAALSIVKGSNPI